MKSHVASIVALIAGVALLVAFAFARESSTPVSTFSTFDGGINGFEALYNVLHVEGIDVERLTGPFDLRDPKVRVVAFAPGVAEYDKGDIDRFTRFERAGGKLVFFGPPKDAMLKRLRDSKLIVQRLDAGLFTNGSLARKPENAAIAYGALTGRGTVLFDERLQGYDEERSMWSVVPASARIALAIVAVAILIVLVNANVRAGPPIEREPPPDRDSSSYIASMAALLRNARARSAALQRFAAFAPSNRELATLAHSQHASDAQLVQAARIFQQRRKDKG